MKPNLEELKALAATRDALPRHADIPAPELREATGDSPGGVRYYAVVYDSLSVDMGGWRERIAPGAFEDSLHEDDIRAMVNHDRAKVIARRSVDLGIDTLQITDDERGVLFDIPTLPNTTAARDLVEDLKVRNITGASFGFFTVEDSWDWEGTAEDGIYVRTVVKARMFEGSPVSFPAYPETVAEARSIATALAEARAGKALSTKSADELRGTLDTLRTLLEEAGEDERETPAGDTVEVRSDERADAQFSLDIAKLRLRAHELAETTITP